MLIVVRGFIGNSLGAQVSISKQLPLNNAGGQGYLRPQTLAEPTRVALGRRWRIATSEHDHKVKITQPQPRAVRLYSGLQQFDRFDLQRVTINIAGHIHAQMVILARRLELFNNLLVPSRVEL